MLDTVKLRSPYLTEAQAAAVEAQLVMRRAVDCATGELLYEFISGPLAGSYDHRVRVAVQREEWVSEVLPESGRVYTAKQPCPPYIEMEGSVHKAMLGHNIEGGPVELLPSLRWFVAEISARLEVELPIADGWSVRQLDWAEVYELGFEAAQEYVQGLSQATYPRRKVHRYYSGLISPGTTTAVKVYMKGLEFRKHDRPRFRAAGYLELAQQLEDRAHELLRLEVSVKSRKLDEDFNGVPRVDQLSEDYLTSLYDRECGRLLREGKCAMEIVRTARAVRRRLGEVYSAGLATSLFGTWVQFSALGEDEARREMKRATFYLHRKQLQEAGISWHGADVAIVNRTSLIPPGFAPVRKDTRRVTSVDPRVVTFLGPYREMAAD